MKIIAEGNTAEIYEYGEQKICKLFFEGYPGEYIEHEFNNSSAANRLGIKTPKAYGLIEEKGRVGIIYDRVYGENLSDKIKPKSFGKWIAAFAEFHKQLLKYKVNDILDYKEFLRMFAKDSGIIEQIDRLPDDNCFIHGDYHLQNVIVTEDDSFQLIDMMNVCKGPMLYDIARTYFLLSYDSEIQNLYLKQMRYSLEDIQPYLDVIISIRENELRRQNA